MGGDIAPRRFAVSTQKRQVRRRYLISKAIELFGVTVYSYIMTKREKLLSKAQNNPKGLSFADFQTLLTQTGWQFDRQAGSHQIWYSPNGYRISIQNGNSGQAKGYQVEQFLAQYEVENG
jgi:hypothetical protein